MSFRTSIERQIKVLLARLGLDIRRRTVHSNTDLQLAQALHHFKIDMVLDVGANKGQFANGLRAAGYGGELVSFEPLSHAHRLLSRQSWRDPRWRVHRRSAIGNREGEIKINISGNSVSSSLLPMTNVHRRAGPQSGYIGREMTPITRLDSVAGSYLENIRRPFLKIDTQGYEWEVLDGAAATLPVLQGIQCELSLVGLYEGQKLWTETIRRLNDEGFVLWTLQGGFVDPSDGRTLQVDAIFFRL